MHNKRSAIRKQCAVGGGQVWRRWVETSLKKRRQIVFVSEPAWPVDTLVLELELDLELA
jgi:hypothetical protein